MAQNTAVSSSASNDLEGALFGFGNPLLDISIVCERGILQKHGVEHALGTAILAEPHHLPLYNELASHPFVEYIAGGAAQNSIRVAQWMLDTPGSTVYMGSIGKDSYGRALRNAAERDGVVVHYYEDDAAPTGTCAVCVVGTERALVANLGAANNFKHDHILTPTVQSAIEKAKVFYHSGFFLTVSLPTVLHIGKYAAESNKIYALNISAIFVAKFFTKHLLECLPYADFVFGNEEEARSFSQALNLGTDDLSLIATHVSNMSKVNTKRNRIVVFTQGKLPIVTAQNGQVTLFETPHLDQSKVVDTNGAGDAFVGGFLSQLLLGKPLEQCVRAGNYSAQEIIQRSGCSIPLHKPQFV